MRRSQWFILFSAGALAGCSSSEVRDAGNGVDDAAVVDGGGMEDVAADTGMPTDAMPGDAAPAADAGMEFRMIHNCAMADYVDATGMATPTISATAEVLRWNPPCLRIRAGQSVTWNAPLMIHPLRPGLAPDRMADPMGTEPNPIMPRNDGMTATFMFPNSGFYPYYCNTHYPQGMIGTIWVEP